MITPFAISARRWLCLLLFPIIAAPLSLSAEELTFSFSLSGRSVAIESISGSSVVDVTDGEYLRLSEEGRPALPFRVINLLLPQGEEIQDFRFSSDGKKTIARNINVPTAPPLLSENGLKGAGEMLFTDSEGGDIFPPSLGKYLGTGYLHGWAIASFAIFHLQLQGGDLLLNERISLSVSTTPSPSNKDVAIRLRYREGFREELRQTLSSLVVNADLFDRYETREIRVPKRKGGFQPTSAPSLEGSPVDYIIITDSTLAPEYQRLADWKTAKGVPTVVRTIEWIEANFRNGVDLPETIRFFLREAYEKWGIRWALLGGDTDVIPARYALSRFYGGGTLIPTDLYFACLDGSWNDTHDYMWGEGYYYVPLDNPDLYAEVYVGRLPTSTVSDVSTIVDKIISYETPIERDYMDKVLFLSEVLFPVDWEEGDPISLNGADYSESIYNQHLIGKPLDVTRSYETYTLYSGAVPESRAATIDSMNAGFNIINHIGHGFRFNMSVADFSVINSDADALINADRYFSLYMLNCTAAAFDYNCLAEHYLRNPNGGAVTVVGASRSAFPGNSNYYMKDYYDLLFDQDFVHVGETFARSRLNRTPMAQVSDNIELWTHYIYVILSDPEVPLWTGPVDTLDVSHLSNVGLGLSSISVSVTSNGQPVDSALVCLSKDKDDYQYAATDASGNADFDFTCEVPGSISVVVTGKNHARHQSYIVVDPSLEAYVNYSALSVDDDSTAGSFGNGDGSIDAGETVDLTLEFINTGGAASDSVWCVLRSSDTLVAIEDSICAVGVLGVGETKQALDPVRLSLAAGASDEAPVELFLEIHDDSGHVWNDTFRKLIHSPRLDLLFLRIDDSPPYGDGDGENQSGEEFKLYYNLKNYGTGSASALRAELEDLDGAFTFFDSLDTYPEIAHMESAENLVGFHILETSTSEPHYLKITIRDLHGRVYQDTVELRPPTPPSNLYFDASLGSDRIEVFWVKSSSSDVRRYNVYHSLQSGGPYDLATSDPVDHTVFVDASLAPSSRYYFVVTAIDTSGNESSYSNEYSSSTNPPQLEGWPIEMETETVSSPAVGDIDGDGDLEVVVGDKYVYAWHHNGVEMRDGDGDPQSWGVLNTYGQDFVAPIALAQLDSSGGLDIVAVSYSTKEIYCFDYNGDILPGWPQSTQTNTRASAVIADLDGDEMLEIVAVDQNGVLYAWHADGTEFRDGDGNPATQGVFYPLPTPPSWHYQTPAACDIDGDGKDEIIIGTQVDSIYAFNEDGTQVPGWPAATSGDVAGSVAVGDIDGDSNFEIVAATKGGQVIVLDKNGNLLPAWPKSVPQNVFFSPSPAIGDLTGDGKLEIIVASSNGNLYAFDYQGSDLSGWPVVYSSYTNTESSPIISDIDGDGYMDVILGDEAKYINGWDLGGNLLDGFPVAVQDPMRATPAVFDLDLDGDVELIAAGWDKSLYVWDMNGTYNSSLMAWPTFHCNLHRNGQSGFVVPTAIAALSFTYHVLKRGIELIWTFPIPCNQRFDIYRMIADNPSAWFAKVASNVSPDHYGLLRYYDAGAEPGRSYVYKLVEVGEDGEELTTKEIYVPVPDPELLQNYPNPFNPLTNIVFFVPDGAASRVTLVVYDVTGARVRTLVDTALKPGRYVKTWDGRDNAGNQVGTGVYFYQLKQDGFVATKKMLLLK